MPNRLLIGMLSFLILVSVVCNMLEGQNAYVTGAPLDSELINRDYTTSTTTSGTQSNFISMAINFLDKYILFHYSLFYDVDPVTGVNTDNDFAIIRYLCIMILVVIAINLFILLRAAAISA